MNLFGIGQIKTCHINWQLKVPRLLRLSKISLRSWIARFWCGGIRHSQRRSSTQEAPWNAPVTMCRGSTTFRFAKSQNLRTSWAAVDLKAGWKAGKKEKPFSDALREGRQESESSFPDRSHCLECYTPQSKDPQTHSLNQRAQSTCRPKSQSR